MRIIENSERTKGYGEISLSQLCVMSKSTFFCDDKAGESRHYASSHKLPKKVKFCT